MTMVVPNQTITIKQMFSSVKCMVNVLFCPQSSFECCFSSKRPSLSLSSPPLSLQWIGQAAERLIGCHLPSIDVLHNSRARKRAGKIIADPFLPKTLFWQTVQVNYDQNLPPPEQFLPWPSPTGHLVCDNPVIHGFCTIHP